MLLGIALTAGLIKGYCGKIISNYTSDLQEALTANSVRMGLCVFVGFVLLCFQGGLRQLSVDWSVLGISAMSGIAMSVFVVSWLLAVKNGVYMLVEVFVMLGVLIPMVLAKIFLAEQLHLQQWIGFGILVAATLVMCSYSQSRKQKLTGRTLLLLTLCGLGSGFADFSQKLFVRTASQIPASVFNFYTYIFSFAVMVTVLALLSKKETTCVPMKRTVQKTIVFLAVMALCLFANSYFKTLAASYLDSAQMYPLNQGAALILSMGMSAIFFREKIAIKSVMGTALAFVGLLVMNVF